MSKLITMNVDGQELQVEEGKNLIDALSAVGIHIPHFCYHPALGFDGNCRMCLVEVEGARGPQIACNTPVKEGMKVSLSSESSMNLRRKVLEFELINHPLDCPICDQAGECKLQDYYMEAGLSKSRMEVEKVAKEKNLDFGCGVVHDQERCVLCARCVRFLRKYTKTAELGIVNRCDKAKVTTFPEKPINNRYALNVVDICPVGAMTSRDFRFKQRVWFMSSEKSVCHGCAKGCSIYVDHNQEKYKAERVYRFRPRENAQVNGHFMCDAGRLSYRKENENRLTTAKASERFEAVDIATSQAVALLSAAKGKAVFIVSPSWTTEQMAVAKSLATHYDGYLSGYADGYIVKGDGDDLLLKEDKAANRASLELLGISTDRQKLISNLKTAEVVVVLNNDLSLTASDKREFEALFAGKQVIFVGSHRIALADSAQTVIPCASYTEYAGVVVNVDSILQEVTCAIEKECFARRPEQVMAALSGNAIKAELGAVRQQLSASVPALAQVDWNAIPENGLNLKGGAQ
ncbi:2Fe-2S iron-sulfur cluster-binding protein [Chrysiogenes arsenatis]|uniref:2Fe-2S iron-sulfur cluster-binding protein n=1 Tax=Chrysiogenes arsenatis TaxID=309797 RepID=UPI0004038E08|nr:2Fe-2S iron-sulfur cluster-binding protein [Chrysiogenes arsenatis]